MNMKEFFNLVKATVKEWTEDKASILAAALAYYTVFSIAPLLVVAVTITGLFLANSQQQILDQIQLILGPSFTEAVEPMIQGFSNTGQGVFWTVVGFGVTIFSASNLFVQLENALNMIWDVEQKKGGFVQMVQKRFFSFLLVLGVGVGFLLLLVVSVALSAADQIFTELFTGFELVSQIINFLFAVAVLTGLFAVLFKIVPDVEIEWSDVLVGSAVTAILFQIGTIAIGLYLGNQSLSDVYGAAASLVVILLWIYYSAQIVFFGAEFTQVYARRYGKRIQPTEGAVRIGRKQDLPERGTSAGIPVQQGPAAGAGAAPPPSPLYQDRMQRIPITGSTTTEQKEPSPARKSMLALAGISMALLSFIGSLVFRRTRG